MTTKHSIVSKWITDCLDLVYPRLCWGCGCALLTMECEVCLSCLAQLPRTGFVTRVQNNPLYDNLSGLLPLSGAVSWLYYEPDGLSQRLIHILKYEDRPELASVLGRAFVSELLQTHSVPPKTVVMPIPLHPTKLKLRGYNQAGLFGKAIASGLGLPYTETVLKRSRHTESQTGKDRNARRNNMKSAFQATQRFDLPVMLIDDVATSGATLEAAGQALIQAGTPEIFICTLAFVQSS